MIEICLPALGAAQSATIERYYKQPGATVSAGEPLLIAVTDRFEWDVPATANGTITEILAEPGRTAAVGDTLVLLDPGADQDQVAAFDRSDRRIGKATPTARRMAMTHDLDLTVIAGSGPGGRIMRADVAALLDRHDPAHVGVASTFGVRSTSNDHAVRAAPPASRLFTSAQRDRAALQIQQKTSVPHAVTAIEADVSACLAYVDQHAPRLLRRGIQLDLTACIVAAAVQTLSRHRLLNSAYSDDGVILWQRINLLVNDAHRANATPVGITNAADLSVQGMARALLNRATAADQRPTFTLTFGTPRWSHAIIASGCSAALSIGAVESRPIVIEHGDHDEIAARPLLLLTLTYDARSVTLPEADAFMIDLRHRLEHFRPL